MTLTCATTNAGKFREFLFAYPNVEMLRGMREIPPCAEDGDTFQANAMRKAIYYSRHARGVLFADDSGLEVGALNGEPGVRSARFAGEHATGAENNALLLDRMKQMDDRRARFVCAIALACHGEPIQTFRGEVEGEILHAPRGSGGFGYDPLFFYPALNCSMAELNEEEKFAISHRGNAFREMIGFLRRLDLGPNAIA